MQFINKINVAALPAALKMWKKSVFMILGSVVLPTSAGTSQTVWMEGQPKNSATFLFISQQILPTSTST